MNDEDKLKEAIFVGVRYAMACGMLSATIRHIELIARSPTRSKAKEILAVIDNVTHDPIIEQIYAEIQREVRSEYH